jgi:uncharacterized damage-inducible protein DinB
MRVTSRRRRAAEGPVDLTTAAVEAWKTINGVTVFLVERIPRDLWTSPVPGFRRKTVRSIGAHLHNSRVWWIRTLGAEFGISAPAPVDQRTLTRARLAAALNRSSRGMVGLLELGAANGGSIPRSKRYVWRNLPLDVGHLLAYFAAHEGHHRGQIVMLARQLGKPLPREAREGLWAFSSRVRERRRGPPPPRAINPLP